MHSSKFGTVMPSGISTMPCHGVHRKENNRYRHLERSHGSLSNTKGVCNKKTANEFKCHFFNPYVFEEGIKVYGNREVDKFDELSKLITSKTQGTLKWTPTCPIECECQF